MGNSVGRLPPLPASKRHKPYKPPSGEPGHDGRRPILTDPANLSRLEKLARDVVQRNANHCVICRLEYRKHLTKLQHKVAERLQDDYAKAGLASTPGTLAALGVMGGCSGADMADMKIDASKRIARAYLAVGTGGRFLLEKIVCEDITLKAVSQLLRVKDNAVLPALRVALDALAAHYGVAPVEDARALQSRIRAEVNVHPFQNDALAARQRK